MAKANNPKILIPENCMVQICACCFIYYCFYSMALLTIRRAIQLSCHTFVHPGTESEDDSPNYDDQDGGPFKNSLNAVLSSLSGGSSKSGFKRSFSDSNLSSTVNDSTIRPTFDDAGCFSSLPVTIKDDDDDRIILDSLKFKADLKLRSKVGFKTSWKEGSRGASQNDQVIQLLNRLRSAVGDT